MRYFLSMVCALFMSFQAFCFPALTGGIVDEANVLSPETEQVISQIFERQKSYNLVVASVRSLEGKSIEDYARDLGNYWGVGNSAKNDGVILLFAPNERVFRIVTGLGMEKILTNERADEIVDQMIPYLKNNDYNTAAIIGVQAIMLSFEKDKAEQYLFYGASILIVLCCAYYVMSAPKGEKMDRLFNVIIGALSLVGLALLFFLTFGRKGGDKFSGGGHFGGGGSTGHF